MNTQININGQVIEAPSTLPDRKFRAAWVLDGKGGVTLDPVKRNEIAMRLFEEAIEAHIEATAQAVSPNTGHQRYSSAQSCVSYINSTKPAWKAEAEAFVAWRDDIWEYAFAELAKVQAGERDEPTIEAFIAELPAITWPV